MDLSLRLLDTLSFGGPKEYYSRNYKLSHIFFPNTPEEKTVQWVVAPLSLVRDYGHDDRIGFTESEDILVPRDMHYAEMPFAALYLYFAKMDAQELNEHFGDIMGGRVQTQVREIVLGVTLNLAKDMLRVDEMKDLIHRFRANSDYRSEWEETFTEIIESYNPTHGGALVLLQGQRRSDGHYVATASQKLEAHHHNKHVTRSRIEADLRADFGATAIDSYWVSSVDLGYRSVIKDQKFKNMVPEIVAFLDQIARLEPGTEVKIGRDESRILYTSLEEAMSIRTRRVPYEIIDGTSVGENILKTNKNTAPFIQALALRFRYDLNQELKNVANALETVGERKRLGYDRNLAQLIREEVDKRPALPSPDRTSGDSIVEASLAMTPTEREGAVEELVRAADVLASALTGADEGLMEVGRISRAKALLEGTGVDITSLDQRLEELMSRRYSVLEPVKERKALPAN
ncbi:MAG: hypothetical protein WCV90_00195 [Candidatus Woesearchaeota archaeon]